MKSEKPGELLPNISEMNDFCEETIRSNEQL